MIFSDRLSGESRRLDVKLAAGELDSLCKHYELLRKWNRAARLVGTIDPERAAVELFADSIVACRFAEKIISSRKDRTSAEAISFVDIGAGAGLPGLPIKALRPGWRATLVESQSKKAAFLKNASRTLGFSDVRVESGRAEELAHRPDLRETFDLAFCRAVGAPSMACELAVPFLRIGGSFVLQTIMRAEEEGEERVVENLLRTAATLGSTIGQSMTYILTGVPVGRALIEVRKKESTLEEYPRNFRIIRNKPLS